MHVIHIPGKGKEGRDWDEMFLLYQELCLENYGLEDEIDQVEKEEEEIGFFFFFFFFDYYFYYYYY